jgi:Flp pilus assembly protein TadG
MIFRALTRLRSDEHGASIIELALTAPFLAALVIGITDLARAYSYKLLLEQVAARTIEKVEQQRSITTSGYNTSLVTEAKAGMTDAGYPDNTDSHYSANSWVECSTNGTTWTTTADFTTDCASGTMARYASIKITESFTPMFPSRAWPNADAQGNITVTGYAEVRMQ